MSIKQCVLGLISATCISSCASPDPYDPDNIRKLAAELYEVKEIPANTVKMLTSGSNLVALKAFQPQYKRRQLHDGVTGCVTAIFDVMPDGKPINVEIVKSVPKGEFDQQVSETLQLWRFEPRDTPVRAMHTITFLLEGSSEGHMFDYDYAKSNCSK